MWSRFHYCNQSDVRIAHELGNKVYILKNDKLIASFSKIMKDFEHICYRQDLNKYVLHRVGQDFVMSHEADLLPLLKRVRIKYTPFIDIDIKRTYPTAETISYSKQRTGYIVIRKTKRVKNELITTVCRFKYKSNHPLKAYRYHEAHLNQSIDEDMILPDEPVQPVQPIIQPVPLTATIEPYETPQVKRNPIQTFAARVISPHGYTHI